MKSTQGKSKAKGPSSLRAKAERLLRVKSKSTEKTVPDDAAKLVHELQVHQIELEMQNESLQKAQAEIEEARSRYFDLYDLAPVGYFTFDPKGMILEANLTGANLLETERSRLLRQPFIRFVSPEFRNTFHLYLERVFSTGTKETCEIKIAKRKGALFYALLEGISKDNEGDHIQCRSAIIDITERKHAHEALKESEKRLRYLSSQLLLSQENERRKIAVEIHDGLGQVLTSAKFKLEEAINLVKKGTTNRTAEPLAMAFSMLQEAANEARRIQLDLRPSILDDIGIVATLSWFLRRYQATYPGIRVEQEMGIGEDEVPDSLKTVIYRIAQEAMNNIAKHSKAGVVKLSVRKVDRNIELTIQDNGIGFDRDDVLSKEKPGKGLGLVSMRERAELSRGSCSIESQKGAGTIIRARWPLKF